MRNAPEAAKREVARGRRAVMLSGDDVVDLEGRVADILRQLAVLATGPARCQTSRRSDLSIAVTLGVSTSPGPGVEPPARL